MYSSVAFAKLYTPKVPVTAADLLNDRVLPFFDDEGVTFLRILTDLGTEYCGAPERHPYEIFLEYHEIEHTKTRARRPQSNGICESFHKTVLNEFCRVAFRKKIYASVEELQKDLDEWLLHDCILAFIQATELRCPGVFLPIEPNSIVPFDLCCLAG